MEELKERSAATITLNAKLKADMKTEDESKSIQQQRDMLKATLDQYKDRIKSKAMLEEEEERSAVKLSLLKKQKFYKKSGAQIIEENIYTPFASEEHRSVSEKPKISEKQGVIVVGVLKKSTQLGTLGGRLCDEPTPSVLEFPEKQGIRESAEQAPRVEKVSEEETSWMDEFHGQPLFFDEIPESPPLLIDTLEPQTSSVFEQAIALLDADQENPQVFEFNSETLMTDPNELKFAPVKLKPKPVKRKQVLSISSLKLHPKPEVETSAQRKCPICSIRLYGLDRFISHMAYHESSPLLRCWDCTGIEVAFSTPARWKAHIANRHPDCMLLECGGCEQEFQRPQDLQEHITSEHYACYACVACLAEFASEEELEQHSLSHGFRTRLQTAEVEMLQV